MKSAFDLRPNPPPSSVTFTFTLSSGRPRRLARLVRAACGDCTQPHASQESRADPRERGRRLHGGVGEMRQIVLRLDLARGRPPSPRRRRRHCAPPCRAGAPRPRARPVRVRGIAGVRSVVPGDLQRLATLDRRPGVAWRRPQRLRPAGSSRGSGVGSIGTILTTPWTFIASAASKLVTLPPRPAAAPPPHGTCPAAADRCRTRPCRW